MWSALCFIQCAPVLLTWCWCLTFASTFSRVFRWPGGVWFPIFCDFCQPAIILFTRSLLVLVQFSRMLRILHCEFYPAEGRQWCKVSVLVVLADGRFRSFFNGITSLAQVLRTLFAPKVHHIYLLYRIITFITCIARVYQYIYIPLRSINKKSINGWDKYARKLGKKDIRET